MTFLGITQQQASELVGKTIVEGVAVRTYFEKGQEER